jgi:hypothetical protein
VHVVEDERVIGTIALADVICPREAVERLKEMGHARRDDHRRLRGRANSVARQDGAA